MFTILCREVILRCAAIGRSLRSDVTSHVKSKLIVYDSSESNGTNKKYK